MPKSMSVASAIEKNKIASGNTFLLLLEIQLVNADTGLNVDTIYVVNNNENVVYDLNTYVAYPFDLELKQESGGMPQITLTAIDYQKVLLGHLNSLSGASGSMVIMRIVNSGDLSAEPEIEERFNILTAQSNNFAISLTLGAENYLRRNFPTRNQMQDRCRWRYKSSECGYVGAMGTCDLSLQGANGCTAHGNELRFGGFPGLVQRGMRR